jgi:hypothetical protein
MTNHRILLVAGRREQPNVGWGIMCARGAAAGQEGGLLEGRELQRRETNSWIQYIAADGNLQASAALCLDKHRATKEAVCQSLNLLKAITHMSGLCCTRIKRMQVGAELDDAMCKHGLRNRHELLRHLCFRNNRAPTPYKKAATWAACNTTKNTKSIHFLPMRELGTASLTI